jgi:maleate cis-trans isomerase
MLGWRARIGIVVPATNTATESEFWKILPEGVTYSFARALSSRDSDQVRRLSGYQTSALKGATEVAEVKPDLIVWACTSGSFLNGVGYDRTLSSGIESAVGIPVLTTSSALIAAINALGVKRVALGTPYPQPVTDIEARFFADSVAGLEVVNTGIIDLSDPYSRGLIEPEQAYELGRRIDRPDAEAIILSCTDLQTFSILRALEADLGKPVISSNSATAWAMFRRLGIQPPNELGRLATLVGEDSAGAAVERAAAIPA